MAAVALADPRLGLSYGPLMSMNVHVQTGDVRQMILDAAVQLFERDGYEATSVNKIMASIGMTKGAFYHHFQNKEEILLTIHDIFIQQELDALTRIEREQDDPREALTQAVEMIISSVEQYGSYMTVFFEQRRRLGLHHFHNVKQKRDTFEKKIVDIIERGIASGVFKDVESSRVLAFGIIGMSAWAYQWYRTSGKLDAEQVGKLYAKTLLHGLVA